jgi:hypothetical protein
MNRDGDDTKALESFVLTEVYSYESLELAFIQLDAVASRLMSKKVELFDTSDLQPSEVFEKLGWTDAAELAQRFEKLWHQNQYGDEIEGDFEGAEECRFELFQALTELLK